MFPDASRPSLPSLLLRQDGQPLTYITMGGVMPRETAWMRNLLGTGGQRVEQGRGRGWHNGVHALLTEGEGFFVPSNIANHGGFHVRVTFRFLRSLFHESFSNSLWANSILREGVLMKIYFRVTWKIYKNIFVSGVKVNWNGTCSWNWKDKF